MWPFSPQRLGDSISVAGLRGKLETIDDELLMKLGSDGRMRLSHRMTPEIIVATLDLVDGEPCMEQLSSFPGLIKDDVTATWEEFEWHVDPTGPHPSLASGPFLLTEIERGKRVDIYTDTPPSEDQAKVTRSLTNDNIRGGWFIDRMQYVFAASRVRIVGRRAPFRGRAD